MARIVNFELGTMDRMQLHDPIEAKYFLHEYGNRKMLQISTYGRKDRKDQGKLSQTFQLDEKVAEQLFNIIRQHFDFK